MKVFTANEISPFSITLSRYGELYLSPRWSSKTGFPCSASSRIYFIEEGSGFLKTDTQTITMKPGHVYLIPANLHHEYGCSGMKKIYFIFRISSTGKKDLLSSAGRICESKFDPEDLPALQNCYQKNDCVSAMQLRLLLLKNVIRLLQENNIPSPPLNSHSELVNAAIRHIDSDARADMKVHDVSEHLFVSESKLRSAFLAETGVSIGHYIDIRVMHKAEELLKNSKLSIGEISTTLKFCDQFYFCRQFKKHFGKTPSAYRKALKEKQP